MVRPKVVIEGTVYKSYNTKRLIKSLKNVTELQVFDLKENLVMVFRRENRNENKEI